MNEVARTEFTYELVSLTPVIGWRAVYRPCIEGREIFTRDIFALGLAKVFSQEFDWRGHVQGSRKEERTDVVGVRFIAVGVDAQFSIVNESDDFVGLVAPENSLAAFCRAHGLPTPGAA
mgnify:CR=1